MINDAHCHFFSNRFFTALSGQRGRSQSVPELCKELGWEAPDSPEALAARWIKELDANNVGLMYMLAGGTDASNTDPFATKPSAENHWVETGPHIMIVGAASLTAEGAGYSRVADPDTSKPYVMWAGTPYEHLMVPVH